MIAEGRIALNGVTIDTPATLLSTLDGITVDGDPVAAPEPTRLFLYHKPTGLLVTEHDPAGRPTIYDRLPEGLPRLVPVGRLDLNTEGLLLLTTDGGFKRQLELPATGVERTYRARAYGDITQAQLEELIHGIEIDGIRYGQIDANLERRTGANVWIEMTLREGKNREVRRVLEYLGLQVSRLIRLRYGPFLLDDLPVGEIGEVKGYDIVEFRKTLEGGIPADAIRPAKVKPGFRTPPTRIDSPGATTRSGPRAGADMRDAPKRQDRAGSGERFGRGAAPRTGRPQADGRPYAKGPVSDRAGPSRDRSGRRDERTDRPFGKGAPSDRSTPSRDRPFRSNEHGDRPRSDNKPYGKSPAGDRFGGSGERPARGDSRSFAKGGASERSGPPRERSFRSDRNRTENKPFAKSPTGDRFGGSGDRPSRSDNRPYAKSAAGDRSNAPRERSFRGDERGDRGRTDSKPFAKGPAGDRSGPSRDRPFRSDERGGRPSRPPNGGQGTPGRSGGPARPGPRGPRPGGGGSRPGRPGGNR